MKNRKSGFTLMEIMVVIIVIAVLASVAGPMIGSITDQGRASATKSKLSSLKSALLAYQGDVGRFPFTGANKSKSEAYNGDNLLSSVSEDKNVLVCNAELLGSVTNYSKKWKGPYMDSDVGDFMVDAWGTPIQYVAWNKNLYLWSFGPDLTPATAEGKNIDEVFKAQSDGNADCDDIVISVTRFKRALTQKDRIGNGGWTYSASTESGDDSGS